MTTSASIRTKIVVSSQLVLLVVVIVGTAASWIVQTQALEANFRARANQLVQIASLGMANDVWNYDRDGIRQFVEGLFVSAEVEAVMVREMRGNILYGQQRPEPEPAHPLIVERDVTRDGSAMATLRVVFTREPIVHELMGSMGSFLLIMGILMVGTFVGNSIVASRILRPLRSLIRAIEDFGDGRGVPTSPDDIGRDEISLVYRRFLLMSEMVEAKNNTVYQLAYFDSLTGLPNRAQSYAELAKRVELVHQEPSRWFRLSIIDIDNFRVINDTFGMSIGDLVLRDMAGRLKSLCRARGWWAGRLGDDEFLVLAEGRDVPVQGDPSSLVETLSGQYVLMNLNQRLTVSVGHAWVPGDGLGFSEALRASDTALLAAKGSGKACERTFTSEMGRELESRLVLESELQLALERNEFFLEFQPQYSNECHCVTSFEALLRWNNPRLGLVPPTVFIPVAERSGSIVPLGYWVLEHSIAFLHQLVEAGFDSVDVSVNLSSVQIMEQDLVERVAQMVTTAQIDPRRIVLEITESVFIQSFQKVSTTIAGLRGLGFRLSLDDFGTGYSSLSYLREIRFDELKIDRAFLAKTAEDSSSREIFRSIVGLATGLGMSVVVEGVEHPTQLEFCQSHGCHKIQGYLLSRPLALEKVQVFLSQRSWQNWREP